MGQPRDNQEYWATIAQYSWYLMGGIPILGVVELRGGASLT